MTTMALIAGSHCIIAPMASAGSGSGGATWEHGINRADLAEAEGEEAEAVWV